MTLGSKFPPPLMYLQLWCPMTYWMNALFQHQSMMTWQSQNRISHQTLLDQASETIRSSSTSQRVTIIITYSATFFNDAEAERSEISVAIASNKRRSCWSRCAHPAMKPVICNHTWCQRPNNFLSMRQPNPRRNIMN